MLVEVFEENRMTTRIILTPHVKVAILASFGAVPIVGLMIMNGYILEAARPKLLEIREAILGFEEYHLREMMDARKGEYASERRGVEGQKSLFAGIHVAASASKEDSTLR